jgi:aspartate aminotransferase-like enzyme
LREQGVELAGGQGALEGRLIRIGHVGWATEADMRETLDSLAGALGASE